MLLITAITGWLCTVCIGAQLLRWPDTRDLERRLRATRRLNRALKIEIRKRPRVSSRETQRETRDTRRETRRETSRNAVYVSLLSAHGLDAQRATVGAMMLDAMDASAAASVLASGVKPLVAWLRKRDDVQVREFLSRNVGGTK